MLIMECFVNERLIFKNLILENNFQLCLTLEGGTEPSVINMEGKLFP